MVSHLSRYGFESRRRKPTHALATQHEPSYNGVSFSISPSASRVRPRVRAEAERTALIAFSSLASLLPFQAVVVVRKIMPSPRAPPIYSSLLGGLSCPWLCVRAFFGDAKNNDESTLSALIEKKGPLCKQDMCSCVNNGTNNQNDATMTPTIQQQPQQPQQQRTHTNQRPIAFLASLACCCRNQLSRTERTPNTEHVGINRGPLQAGRLPRWPRGGPRPRGARAPQVGRRQDDRARPRHPRRHPAVPHRHG